MKTYKEYSVELSLRNSINEDAFSDLNKTSEDKEQHHTSKQYH